MKTYRKLRQITNDPRRKSIMFYNEICEATKVLREPNESASLRDARALCKMAEWYDLHLNHEKHIIILSELPHNNPHVMTTKQYLDIYFPDNQLLQNLVQVLADVVIEDEDDNKIKIASKRHGGASGDVAVSGYAEYKSMQELEVGIKSARYFSGILRCRKDSREQAYVTGQLGKDILIIGNENRNRAGKIYVYIHIRISQWLQIFILTSLKCMVMSSSLICYLKITGQLHQPKSLLAVAMQKMVTTTNKYPCTCIT